MIFNLIQKAKEVLYKNGKSVEAALDEINESTDVSNKSYIGYTYNEETGYVNASQPMVCNGVVGVLDGLGNNIAQIVKGYNAANGNLATKNLKTYTSLAQISCTTENTISEVMASLPANSVLDTGVSTTASNFTNSLPVVSAGRAVLTKQYSKRGVAIFTRFSNGTTWINPYMDNVFVGWVRLATTDDLDVRNLRTYTALGQLEVSTGNTLKEVMYALPTNSTLELNVPSSDGAFWNSLPVQKTGFLELKKGDSSTRGIGRFTTNGGSEIYESAFYGAEFVGWKKLVLDSDLSDYAKIQKGSGNVTIVSPTTTPPPTEVTFTKAFSSVPTVMLDSQHRHLISFSDVTKTGFKVYGMNNELSEINGTFIWVAFE